MRRLALVIVVLPASAAAAPSRAETLTCGPDPKDPSSGDWMNRPMTADRQSADADCLDIIAQTAPKDRNHIAALVNLGALRGSLYRDYDGEIGYESQALAIDPNNGTAYANRAFAYRAKGDVDHTIADLTRALALNPAHDDAVRFLDTRADAYDQKHEHELALADYRAAAALDPDDYEAKTALEYERSTRMGGVVLAAVGGVFGTLALVGLGAAILLARRERRAKAG